VLCSGHLWLESDVGGQLARCSGHLVARSFCRGPTGSPRTSRIGLAISKHQSISSESTIEKRRRYDKLLRHRHIGLVCVAHKLFKQRHPSTWEKTAQRMYMRDFMQPHPQLAICSVLCSGHLWLESNVGGQLAQCSGHLEAPSRCRGPTGSPSTSRVGLAISKHHSIEAKAQSKRGVVLTNYFRPSP
jgi:hypothetical protein